MESINFYSLHQVKDKTLPYYGTKVSSPKEVSQFIQTVLDLQSSSVEKFGILTTDVKNNVAGIHILFIGTVNQTAVYPREVFTAALLNNAVNVILFHNHPSGDPAPSAQDIKMTEEIREAGKVLGISVLDHIITGDDGKYFSFGENRC